jgi:hypothetical protein
LHNTRVRVAWSVPRRTVCPSSVSHLISHQHPGKDCKQALSVQHPQQLVIRPESPHTPLVLDEKNSRAGPSNDNANAGSPLVCDLSIAHQHGSENREAFSTWRSVRNGPSQRGVAIVGRKASQRSDFVGCPCLPGVRF